MALMHKEKGVVKLTAKAFFEERERLQSDKKAKLNKASSLRKHLEELMQRREVTGSMCF